MPSVSKKQARFMAAAAHNPRFAKEAGIDQDVAQEFFRADQHKQRRQAVEKAYKKVRAKHE